MAKTVKNSKRRMDALTLERIVDAAIELLDSEGENRLTFRALAARLETGHGAIQWYVPNKNELLKTATKTAVSAVVTQASPGTAPHDAIRALALGLFNAMDAHPWVGRELIGSPWQPTMLWIFELIGRQVKALRVSSDKQFTATSALVTYIIGAGGRESANSRAPEASGNRQELLDAMATVWGHLDPNEYWFTRTMTEQLRRHDDREEFLAGINLILDGLETTHLPLHELELPT